MQPDAIQQHQYAGLDTGPEERALALIELADWYLLYERTSPALEKYREAQETLLSAGIPKADIRLIMNPEMPVALPIFSPLPHSRELFRVAPDSDLSHKGYIDLSFKISKFGKAKRIRVLDKSPSANRKVENRLTRLVSQSQFRPYPGSDLSFGDHPVALRYYYTYPDELPAP